MTPARGAAANGEARMTAPFPAAITSIEELRGLIQPPSEMVCRKVILTADAVDRSLQESYRTTLY